MKFMQIIKRMFLYSAVMLSCFDAHAISTTAMYAATGMVGAVSALASYKGMPALGNDIHPVAFGVASIVATASTYCCLYSFTPEGRLKKANNMLKHLLRNKLIRHSFAQDRVFFDIIHDVYLTYDLPLISAYNHLISQLPVVYDSIGLTKKALAGVGKDYKLKYKCNVELKRAKIILRNISHAIKRIREHKDYLPQLHIYKEFLVNDKYAAAHEQMAYAHVRLAQAKQSSTILKWVRTFFGL